MPLVPRYDNFQAMPGAEPNVAFRPSQAGEVGAQQMQRLGQAVEGAGATGGEIYRDIQNQVSQTLVNHGNNQLRQATQDLTYDPRTGYLNLKGLEALERPDGQSLEQEYGAKFDAAVSTISDGMKTSMQKQMFQQSAAEQRTHFMAELQKHMLQQYNNFHVSVQDGTIKLAADDAMRNWQDPTKVVAGLQAAKQAVYDKGQTLGWSASQVEAAQHEVTSAVHSKAIMAALDAGNASYAAGYMDRFRGEMTGDDILKISGTVGQQMDLGTAQKAVEAASVIAKPTTSDFGRMVQITLGAESRGRRYGSDGELLTSSAGAKGEMQVMPATNKDPGYGVRPAKDDSPDELARVGRDYLQAMLRKYGDPGKAWAAYNAGPGRLDDAMAKAKKQGGDWLQYMPDETKAYVTKNMAQLSGGETGADRPTVEQFVQAALDRLPAGASPKLVQMTTQAAQQKFAMLRQSADQQGDNAVRQAQVWLAQNQGDFDAMPASMRQAVVQYAPDKLPGLQNYGKALAPHEEPVKTDMVLYNRLVSHPDELAKMTDAQFEALRPSLADSDFKHMAMERVKAKNGGAASTSPTSLNSAAVQQALNNRLLQAGINPTPAKTDIKGRARVGTIQQFINDSLYTAQQEVDKKFTPQEIEQHLDRLFMHSVPFRGLLGGITDKNLLSMKADDIPSADKEGILRAFQAHGVANPTDDQILRAYWQRRSTAKN